MMYWRSHITHCALVRLLQVSEANTEAPLRVSQLQKKFKSYANTANRLLCIPFLMIFKSLPNVLSFWLQEAPVVLVIQPFAAEVQTHNLI